MSVTIKIMSLNYFIEVYNYLFYFIISTMQVFIYKILYTRKLKDK